MRKIDDAQHDRCTGGEQTLMINSTPSSNGGQAKRKEKKKTFTLRNIYKKRTGEYNKTFI